MKRCIAIAAWSMAFALSAYAQTTTLVLEGTIAGKPALNLVVYDQVAGRDFNDDGVPDPAFLSKIGVLPRQVEIVDGMDLENGWIVLPEIDDEVLLNFNRAHVVGFVELDPAADLKATIIAERQGRRYMHPIIVDGEGALLWNGSGRVLLAVNERIVVFDPETSQVEIWRAE